MARLALAAAARVVPLPASENAASTAKNAGISEYTSLCVSVRYHVIYFFL